MSTRTRFEEEAKGNSEMAYLLFSWMLGTAYQLPGARFSKVPKTFRFRKAIRKTPTRLFCKAGLFICCEGDKNHDNCKVSCLRRDAFFLKKRQLSPEMRSKDFRETGSRKRYEMQSSGQAISKGFFSSCCFLVLPSMEFISQGPL